MGRHTFSRGLAIKATLASIAVVVLTVASGFWAAHWLRSEEASEAIAPPPVPRAPAGLFRDWPADRKPDVALLLSAQQQGYLQPCGCSRPQLGGLARRYNFLQTLLKDRGWPVVPVDLGDVADGQKHRGPQALLKYATSMEALKRMGYLATGIGLHEAELSLFDALGAFALNSPQPRVLATNLQGKDENFAGMVQSTATSGGKDAAVKVGVVAIVGPSVAQGIAKQDASAKFAPTAQELPKALKQLEKDKADLRVLLYQGSIEEAKSCVGRFPQFHVVLCPTREEEPSDRPERVGDTLVVGVGHKGRYVGVVGAYRTKAKPGFELRYQLVSLGEAYETPEGKEAANPIMTLMEDYAEKVHKENYLAQYTQRKHPLQVEYADAKYVGSESCKECHEHAYEVWKKTPHAHAYHSLETAKRPGLRQFDGECIACHTVGFGYQAGFKSEKESPLLKDVGCESCHGPGSLHAKGGNREPKLLALMNPFKVPAKESAEQMQRRLNLIDQACQKCHDTDNDVHWDFKVKWPVVVHHEPKD